GNALAWEGPGSCSPVPNVRYATLPVLGPVAWPGHLLEDRSNSSEAPHEQGRAITAPFDQAGPEGSHADQDGYEAQEDCELKHDLDTWDDEHGDGDPLAGWDSSDPTDLSAYHGPGDQGPSLDPTLGNIWAALAYQVERAIEPVLGGQADCNHADTWIGPWETSGSSGLGGLKTQTTASFSFDTPTTFNPSHAPGGPAPDTYLSPCEQGWYAQDEGSLYCGGAWEGTSFLDVPNEPPGAYLARTARWTAYADVSFQIPDFDPAGDGRFRADPHGVWDAPAGLDVDPARVLPAGSNDAHQYGDAQCDAIEALPTGGDLVATGTPGTEAATPGWSCQREAWMHASGLDCSRIVDERACWADVFVGAPFDLRDVECRDNDVAATSTTDAAGPLGPVGTGPDDNLDCVHR
ncbi:MAG: hypothetical protein R3185_08035, partial [Candidatus Thermoplasmatota archaeon]|nr:hypothetical protein [Candidatus Thermoplasmatota archaeon]